MPQHKGVQFEIERRKRDRGSSYAFEFVLVVDGEDVKTASELEAAGWSGPEDGGLSWTRSLRNYAIGYIDGRENDK